MLRAEVRRHRLDIAEYHRMAETGILSEDDRVELVDRRIALLRSSEDFYETRRLFCRRDAIGLVRGLPVGSVSPALTPGCALL